MENQQSPPQPIQSTQAPAASSKPALPWEIIAVLVIAVIAFSVGTTLFLVKGSSSLFLSQTKPTPTAVINPQPTLPAVNTTDWKTYTDKEAGFSLKYPPDVILNGEGKGAAQNILSISSEPIDRIKDQPIYGGKDEAVKDKEALAKGEITGAGFAADAQVVNLGNLNGKKSTTLAQFEVCSVMFHKLLTFYPNNYRVMIGFSGVEDQIIAQMPEYFKIDQANCGDQKVWNLEKTQAFLEALKNSQGGKSAQNWYDTFEAIVKTITFTTAVTSPNIISPTKIAASLPAAASPTVSSCDVSDNAFCNVLADLKSSLSTNNYAGFLSYQIIQSVTCDPDGMFVAVCEGETKGTVKQGYGIGYVQSEGAILAKNDYLQSVSMYVKSNGPFVYHGSLVSQDKGIAVFLNAKKDRILAFPMKRTGLTWRMDYLLYGFGDDAFTGLSDSILEY